jgi:hypothetical protein
MDVDKHKLWLIIGISIAVLLVAGLLLYPSFKDGFAGKAITAGNEVDTVELKLMHGTLIKKAEFTDSGTKYVLYFNTENSELISCSCGAKSLCPTFDDCSAQKVESEVDDIEDIIVPINCDIDDPNKAYSPNNAPENICAGVGGESKVLLYGVNLGYWRDDEIKKHNINSDTVNNVFYTSGDHACQVQLSSDCNKIQRYTSGKWQDKTEALSCQDSIEEFGTKDLARQSEKKIYRAVCGSSIDFIPPVKEEPNGGALR